MNNAGGGDVRLLCGSGKKNLFKHYSRFVSLYHFWIRDLFGINGGGYSTGMDDFLLEGTMR